MAEKRTAEQVTGTKPKKLGSPSHLSSWEQRFKELESFKEEYGHCNVPKRYQPNPAFGRWVSDVRLLKKLGKLDKEKARCLNALGFCWTRQATWEQRIHDLKAFKKEHGHCQVPVPPSCQGAEPQIGEAGQLAPADPGMHQPENAGGAPETGRICHGLQLCTRFSCSPDRSAATPVRRESPLVRVL